MDTTDSSRKPLPGRIVDDVGYCFVAGVAVGSAFHFGKGLRDSPNGHRLAGGAEAVRMNVPRLGGVWAAWGSVFSAVECALVLTREKEDPLNRIVAGAGAGGFMAMRKGLVSVGRSAAIGAAFLAFTEGTFDFLNRALAPQQNLPRPRRDVGSPRAPTAFPRMEPPAPAVVGLEVAVPDTGTYT